MTNQDALELEEELNESVDDCSDNCNYIGDLKFIIDAKNELILEKNDLLEELMNENQRLRAAVDRLNEYTREYDEIKKRFKEGSAIRREL